MRGVCGSRAGLGQVLGLLEASEENDKRGGRGQYQPEPIYHHQPFHIQVVAQKPNTGAICLPGFPQNWGVPGGLCRWSQSASQPAFS